MNWSLIFSPFIPWWLIAVIAVVAALLLFPAVFRRMRGAWFRLAAAAGLLLALANPILLNEQRDPQTTVVALVVDQSASQKLDNRDKVTEAAVTELQKRLAISREDLTDMAADACRMLRKIADLQAQDPG